MEATQVHDKSKIPGIKPYFPFKYNSQMAMQIIHGVIENFSVLQSLDKHDGEFYMKSVLLFLISETNYRGWPGWSDFPVRVIANEVDLPQESVKVGLELAVQNDFVKEIECPVKGNMESTRYRINLPELIKIYCKEELNYGNFKNST